MHATVPKWFQRRQTKLIYSAHLERSMKLQTLDRPSQVIMFPAEMKVKTSNSLQIKSALTKRWNQHAKLKWNRSFKNIATTKSIAVFHLTSRCLDQTVTKTTLMCSKFSFCKLLAPANTSTYSI